MAGQRRRLSEYRVSVHPSTEFIGPFEIQMLKGMYSGENEPSVVGSGIIMDTEHLDRFPSPPFSGVRRIESVLFKSGKYNLTRLADRQYPGRVLHVFGMEETESMIDIIPFLMALDGLLEQQQIGFIRLGLQTASKVPREVQETLGFQQTPLSYYAHIDRQESFLSSIRAYERTH